MTAPFPEIPPFFEIGYRDGVWVTQDDLHKGDIELDFSVGDNILLMFSTYNLGPETRQEHKNLVGVEITYVENEYLPEVWGLKINKYIDMGSISGRKDWKRLHRHGEFNHVYQLYGEDNVKFISYVADFEALAIKILKYIYKSHKPPNLSYDSAEVVRYYRPLDISEESAAWYADGYWLDKESFEINAAVDLSYALGELPATGIVFATNKLMKGEDKQVGIYMLVYDMIDDFAGTQWSFESMDAYPFEEDFRFLGFLGPHYSVPSIPAVTSFVAGNDLVFEDFANTHVEFYYVGKVEGFSSLRALIVESLLGWSASDQVNRIHIFK